MEIFKDRIEAGKILAKALKERKKNLINPIVLGVPRGGVPIGFYIARELNCPLDAIVLRKLPLPFNPEAGFGAVTIDKTVIFNESMLREGYLSKTEINKIIDNVYLEVLRRNRIYRKDRPLPQLMHRSVVLTDDGLATGFTMLAAVKFAKNNSAREVIVVSPVAHQEAYNVVKKEVDDIIVLHLSRLAYFAVASFYEEFTEMDDREVISYLRGIYEKQI